MRPIVPLLAALLIGAPALAQATPATAAAQAPAEKKTCRYETAVGSTLATRICRTRTEWREIDAAHEASALGFGRQGYVRQQGGGGAPAN